MSLVLETALRNALGDAIEAEMATGAGTSTLDFETSGDGEVASIDLQNPAFGAAAAGVITLQGVPLSDTNAVGGTVEHFSLYDRNGDKQLEGVVAVSGQDMDLSSLVVGATDTVELTSFTLTIPAS